MLVSLPCGRYQIPQFNRKKNAMNATPATQSYAKPHPALSFLFLGVLAFALIIGLSLAVGPVIVL